MTKKKLNKLPVTFPTEECMTVRRVAVAKDKVCYVLVANKAMIYGKKRSKIVYIGTTKKGLERIATSMAGKAKNILGSHGIKTLQVRLISVPERKGVKTWLKLEQALFICFREMLGRIPEFNKNGMKIKETDQFELISRQRIENILIDLS